MIERVGPRACLGLSCAHEIERRPRGASRINPLLHLLQRTSACKAMVVRLGAWLQITGAAVVPAELSRRANEAGNYGLSGHGTLQQM